MKYVILIYDNPASREIWEALSDEERGVGLEAYTDLNRELIASGEFLAAEALAGQALATRVVHRDGRTTTTDGPFAESKELLAGFYLVDCDSHERAVEIAARIPEADFGVVEVRPVMVYSGLEM